MWLCRDLRRAGVRVPRIYVVTSLFDVGVIGWPLYLYVDSFKRLARTPRVPAEALLTSSRKKNYIRIYINS